jgi:penicillin-binding protein 1A
MLVIAGGLLTVVAAGALVWTLAPQLPSIDSLREVQLHVPLRVYTAEGALMAEFGEKRRIPVTVAEVPETLVQAVLAAEDDRFFEHPGVDWQGLTRAVLHVIRTGEKGPGGSTITMQVARNFFLTREKTYARKLNEILLALKIEREISKDEILELYLNKIFLGHRAYGVGAAAQVYYGKSLPALTLAQTAMIAGLPKAPSKFNPIANPERAVQRRDYVLGRMRDLAFISQEQYAEATAAPVSASIHGQRTEVPGAYLAEMVRAWMEERYGEDAYGRGFKVYTTVQSRLQEAATQALRDALVNYDTRHGYRGAEQNGALPASEAEMVAFLAQQQTFGGLLPALVVEVLEKSARVHVKELGVVELPWEGIRWARRHVNENAVGAAPKKAADVLQPGDLVRVKQTTRTPKKTKKNPKPEPVTFWRLTQLPAVEGALVSLSPDDGRILALSGGFDFFHSKFNRAVQAERQPGSSFKPFIYSAALEFGFNPGSIINDAPVVFEDASLEDAWRPENYSGKFFGPTRLRQALYKSRNLVSIRLMRSMGIDYTVEYAQRFGFVPERLPRNLSLSLGTATVTPLEVATGYSVLANGGFKVEPYLVARVETEDGEIVYEAKPPLVCPECEEGVQEVHGHPVAPRVISAENAWLMNSLMGDVIRRGTATRARVLERNDLAGKTGTTNDQKDAWFSGFNRDVVATAWVGFDKLAPLGRREVGGRAALPAWIDYMRVALEGREERTLEQPAGLVSVRINAKTGKPTSASDENGIVEYFLASRAPATKATADAAGGSARPARAPSRQVTKKLF